MRCSVSVSIMMLCSSVTSFTSALGSSLLVASSSDPSSSSLPLVSTVGLTGFSDGCVPVQLEVLVFPSPWRGSLCVSIGLAHLASGAVVDFTCLFLYLYPHSGFCWTPVLEPVPSDTVPGAYCFSRSEVTCHISPWNLSLVSLARKSTLPTCLHLSMFTLTHYWVWPLSSLSDALCSVPSSNPFWP